MGKVFKKGLEKEDKKEGLLKRLKNIKDKNEEQLKMIKNKESKQWHIKSVIDVFNDDLSQEGTNILNITSNQEKSINYKRLNSKRNKNLEFDFKDYKSFRESFKDIYYKNFTLEEVERMQNEFESVLNALEEYSPKSPEYKNNEQSRKILLWKRDDY